MGWYDIGTMLLREEEKEAEVDGIDADVDGKIGLRGENVDCEEVEEVMGAVALEDPQDCSRVNSRTRSAFSAHINLLYLSLS